MYIYLIRHGKTEGNLKKRYIGRTDEPLCELGRNELKEKEKEISVERLYVSPLLRCRQTAEILLPGMEQILVEDFRECDFGEFENKNYRELSEDPFYQKWVDSMGTLPFPGGESRESFSKRCCSAFDRIVKQCLEEKINSICVVAHGGTIMSIMEQAAVPKGSYYDFQVENGSGFLLKSHEGGFFYDRIY